MNNEQKIQTKILCQLLAGKALTTLTGNDLANTVDFRKAISLLRHKGYPILDEWIKNERKRYKRYWLSPEYKNQISQ
jgi:hypothetical protein